MKSLFSDDDVEDDEEFIEIDPSTKKRKKKRGLSADKIVACDTIISRAFREANIDLWGDRHFKKSDLEKIVKEGNYALKNIADIKYLYDARRHLPPEITKLGNFVIIGQRKGCYLFTDINHQNLIEPLPTKKTTFVDQTPELVAEVLGEDEQSTFSIVHYNNIISKFLGFEVLLAQNHKRTTVSCGQVEIDAVYVGKKEGVKHIIPISGKGEDDYLSYTQAYSLNLYGKEKFPLHKCIPLGIKAEGSSIICVEFSPDTEVDKIVIKDMLKFERQT